MTTLFLTERAHRDLDEIERYSSDRRGEQVAAKYMADIGAALGRLESDLSLFSGRPDFAGRLLFYPVRRHVLIGDLLGGVAYVLAVWHGAMDFVERLADFEPQLIREAEILGRQIEDDGAEQ